MNTILKKIIITILLIAIGFIIGTYASNLSVEHKGGQSKGSAFPSTYYGVSTVSYASGTALYVLKPGSPNSVCEDLPKNPCEGSLYEIQDYKLKEVASNVTGRKILYYQPGVKALFEKSWGDGSCRQVKFYVYDFITATSSLSFSADNGCDGFEEINAKYEKSVKDYLSKFGL